MRRRTLPLFPRLRLVRRRLVAAIACCGAFAGAAGAQVPSAAPNVTHLVPSAVAPGKATDVTLFGANLAGASALWSSLGGQVELAPGIANNGKEPGKVTYRITVPAGASVGIGMVRLATDKGVSNARLFLVDDLETVADNGANKSVATAQEIKVP